MHGKLHEYNKSSVEEDWFRTLEKDGNMVLVHWWYYPDSFDSWLPQTQQFTDPEEPPEHNGSWKISVRWLQDTERFNEFMNEEDYEDLDEEEDEEEEYEEEEEEEEEEHEEEGELEADGVEAEEDEEDQEPVTPAKRKQSDIESDDTATATVSIKEQPKLKSVAKQSSSPSSVAMATDNAVFQEPVPPSVPVLHVGYQPVVRVRDIEAEKPQIGSRQRKNEFEPYLNGDLTNISQYTSVNVEYPMRPNKMRKLNEEKSDDKGKFDSV